MSKKQKVATSDMVQLPSFCEHLRQLFGYFEAERFESFMHKNYPGDVKFSKVQLMGELKAMYEKDM